MNSQCVSAVLDLKSAADDNMTWTKGEVLGKGAYGIVSDAILTIKVTLKHVECTNTMNRSIFFLSLILLDFLPGVLWPDQPRPADSCEAGEPAHL